MGSYGDGIRFLEGGDAWFCPACRRCHGGPGWTRIRTGTVQPSCVVQQDGVCHSSVVDGKIHFYPDCTNGWAGRIVDLDKDW